MVFSEAHCGEDFAPSNERGAVPAVRETALLDDAVPFLRMTDVGERGVVVGAPEERHVTIDAIQTKKRARNGLPLSLCNDPVLDAHACAGPRVGIPSDIARCVDVF